LRGGGGGGGGGRGRGGAEEGVAAGERGRVGSLFLGWWEVGARWDVHGAVSSSPEKDGDEGREQETDCRRSASLRNSSISCKSFFRNRSQVRFSILFQGTSVEGTSSPSARRRQMSETSQTTDEEPGEWGARLWEYRDELRRTPWAWHSTPLNRRPG
jgi:hypothetical protein